MTREQAYKKFKKIDSNIKWVDFNLGYMKLLDEIYDDFENRTCKSCRYFEPDRFEDGRGTCRNKNTPTRNFMVDCDYGCNRYEAKGE